MTKFLQNRIYWKKLKQLVRKTTKDLVCRLVTNGLRKEEALIENQIEKSFDEIDQDLLQIFQRAIGENEEDRLEAEVRKVLEGEKRRFGEEQQEEEEELVHFLCEKAIHPNMRHNVTSKTLLHIACESENINLNTLESLLERGFDCNARDCNNQTPLLLACKNPKASAKVIFLLLRSADVQHRDKCGRNAIFHACRKEEPNLEVIKMLIKQGINVNAKDFRGRTVLEHAFKKKNFNFEVIELLCKNGADVNASVNGYSLLQKVCSRFFPSKELVRVLLENGANVNNCSSFRLHPLHLLTDFRDTSIAFQLILYGGDVDVKNPRVSSSFLVLVFNLPLKKKNKTVEEVAKEKENEPFLDLIRKFKEGHCFWSKEEHKIFPKKYRQCALTFLLCQRRFSQETLQQKIPKPIINIILQLLSLVSFKYSPKAN